MYWKFVVFVLSLVYEHFKFSFLYFFLLHVPTFLTMHRREIDTLIDYSCGLRMKVWLVQSGITFESWECIFFELLKIIQRPKSRSLGHRHSISYFHTVFIVEWLIVDPTPLVCRLLLPVLHFFWDLWKAMLKMCHENCLNAM